MEHIVVRISSKRCHMPLDIMSIDMKVILTYVVLVLLTYTFVLNRVNVVKHHHLFLFVVDLRSSLQLYRPNHACFSVIPKTAVKGP